tara:strand:+ start:1513 stop:1929 length:417 start_codon:yes stop_codon:yes gene_type:complete
VKSISKLKKELDKFFSLFIRLRYATEGTGAVQCFTCGKVAHYKTGGMQCGHFQSRRHHSTRWDEKNCEVQCVRCNMFSGNGEQYKFGIALDHKYGEGTAQELEFISKFTTKITRSDYEEKISYYKLAVKNLKKQKSIE